MSTDSIRAIERAFNVLDAFTDEYPVLTLSEISMKVDLPTTTVFRILQTLETRSIIDKNLDGRYQLGLIFLKYERILLKTLDVRSQAREVMKHLSEQAQETVNLFVERDMKRVCIASLEYGTSRLTYKVSLGDVLPLHLGASGRVILANQTQDYWLNYYAKYQEDIELRIAKNYQEFKEQLESVWVQGYAQTFGERERGLNSASAPIRNHKGIVVGALTVTGPDTRVSGEKIEAFKVLVIDGAAAISTNMGFKAKKQ